MKVTRKSSFEERQILTAMIVDDVVCAKITSKWEKNGLFKNKWSNVIAGWCIAYCNRYGKSPKQHIGALYENWSEKTRDDRTIQLVERFLDRLSSDYEKQQKETNSDYIIDLAGKFFTQIKLEQLSEQVTNELTTGQVDAAQEVVAKYTGIELGRGEGINALNDKNAIKEAFLSKSEPIIKYPGDVGRFFGNALEREGFVAFLGPEKRGKTFMLLDLAFRAVMQKRKVVFFEAGDMSQNQIMRRLMTRVSKHPLERSVVKYPVGLKRVKLQDGTFAVLSKIKQKAFRRGLSYKRAIYCCNKFIKTKIRNSNPYLRLCCYPNSTLNFRSIRSTLQLWEREGWVPDVIIIDYMDILEMDYYGLQGRDRINETWKQARSLSQVYHCLLATATQADAASYEKGLLRLSNFSEDKRKYGHVTAMFGLNQTPYEKEGKAMRLNKIVVREEEFHTDAVVHLGMCLDIANPAVISSF